MDLLLQKLKFRKFAIQNFSIIFFLKFKKTKFLFIFFSLQYKVILF